VICILEANAMARVRIVTDIAAHLEPDFVTRHQIVVLPMEIHFGEERFFLRHGDSPDGLFRAMADTPAKPTEASIPSQAFQEAFERLNRETDEVLVILSSSKLGNTSAQARAASRAFLGRCRITVMDSLSASRGLGLVIEAAAMAAERGQSVDGIVRLVRGMLPHIYLVFFVERLDYLERGGQIGPAQALLGTMLRIKPLLLVEDGEIIPMEKVRTRLMAIEKLADFVDEFATIQQVLILRGPEGDGMEEMIEELRARLSLILPDQEFRVIEYDPVLACHLGPAALGVLVYEGM
jgi:DegV family protein with EDD domain